MVAAANESRASQRWYPLPFAQNPRKHNYAIYDTSLAKASLRVLERGPFGALPELYTILDKYEVALIG